MSLLDRAAALVARATSGEAFADATLTRAGGTGTGNPVTGRVSAVAATTVPCRAVTRPITVKAADGSLVAHTLITLTAEPKNGDRLALAGVTYTLGSITKIAVAGQPVIYQAMAVR